MNFNFKQFRLLMLKNLNKFDFKKIYKYICHLSPIKYLLQRKKGLNSKINDSFIFSIFYF